MGAVYIGTDLEFRARFDPDRLDAALRAAGLFGGVTECRGVWRARYGPFWSDRHPAVAARRYVEIVRALPPDARDEWDRCSSRRLDAGFEGDPERLYSRWSLPAEVLGLVAGVGADWVVTIYRS